METIEKDACNKAQEFFEALTERDLRALIAVLDGASIAEALGEEVKHDTETATC